MCVGIVSTAYIYNTVVAENITVTLVWNREKRMFYCEKTHSSLSDCMMCHSHDARISA